MKNQFIKVASALLLSLFFVTNAQAQESRKPWSEVKNPEITSVALDPTDKGKVIVSFNLDTPRDNSENDKGEVVMSGPSSKIEAVGKTRHAAKTVTFEPEASGEYTFTVYGMRNSESSKHASTSATFNFSYPLSTPVVQLLNKGNGNISVSWSAVKEAQNYIVNYTDASGKKAALDAVSELENTITGLKIGQYSDISVSAVRGSESITSPAIHKLVKDEVEREWHFTWFGSSTGEDRNNMQILDPNNLTVKLNSCTYDSSGNTAIKGGKFTAYFDGISYYYTVIDPAKENFVLKATVHIDYHNPTADGQEGFALLARDSLGEYGINSQNYPTNSAGVVSYKYTTHVNGVKKEIKDGVGARFVSGITPEVLKKGDAGIAENAQSIGKAYSYDQNSDAVRTGRTYNVELRKTNTGYHALLVPEIASEDTITEYIMYDPSKLTQLDKDHVYVGLAVARGCNATFSNVTFTTSDPKTDPVAMEEPPELVDLKTVVDCPTTYYTNKYPFVFSSNSDGVVNVTDASSGKVYIKNGTVKANVDFTKTIKLTETLTDLLVDFKPKDGFRPYPKAVIAQYDRETQKTQMDYKAVNITQTVIAKSYKGKVLYTSTKGTPFGKGTKEDPLDLASAVGYCAPGQTVIMEEGTYYLERGIYIERGNNGTNKARKVLKSEDGKRAVLDFSKSPTGMACWGSYWTFENFDITKTQGDIKGFQIAGNYNILNAVNAYECGDTGIQISGQGIDTFEKWPKYNQILNCTSYGNCDPAQNNADGFAAKLTVNEGNIFRNCVAYSNIDDGWDLYAKIESGPIGAVLIENCIAYRNGTKLDGTGNGDGNGFKLGGEGIAVKHILRNSISFDNGYNGITCNSNPALILENVTSYGNKGKNIALYGKGSDTPRMFKTTGIISANGGEGDDIKEQPTLLQDDTYFFNGSKPQNLQGATLDDSIFKSVDCKSFELKRKADGSIDMQGLFELTDKAPKGVGARL